MKAKIATLLFLSLMMFTSQTKASEIGTYTEEAKISESRSRVMDLVQASASQRATLNKGRSLAGATQGELKWANEYEELMNSDDDKDYLKMALEL